MPTPPKRLDNQTKHLTNRELAARRKAEQGLKRPTRVHLRAPKGLSKDARKVWERVKRQARKLELLDNLDANALARYCALQVRFEKLDQSETGLDDEQIKQLLAYGRLLYAQEEKLGLSPNARARLAKKKAEAEPPDAMTQLLGEVSEFVNEER